MMCVAGEFWEVVWGLKVEAKRGHGVGAGGGD